MAWNLDDTVEIKLFQDYLNEVVINVLHYVITNKVGNPVIATIMNSLASTLVNIFIPVQNSSLTHLEQSFENLTNGLDYYVADNQATGSVSDTNRLASFYSCGMKKNGFTRITRPGSVRVAGMVEENFVGNTIAAGFVTTMNTFGNNLALVRVVSDGAGGSLTFTPIILGRTVFGTPDLSRRNIIEDVITPRITTQNSRKSPIGQF